MQYFQHYILWKGGKAVLEKIKKLAKEKGVTVQQLEQDCGLGKGAVYHWDENKPSYDKVVTVARYLGVTVEDLTP